MVRASSGETHWTGERTPGLRGDEGSGDWFSYCPSLAARLRRGVGGSAGCFSRAFTPGRNDKAEKAMSILCEKRSIGPNSPQRRQRKLRGHAGTGPVSPLHLPPASLCPHREFLCRVGDLLRLGWPSPGIYPAQGWGPEHKGLIQETDVNSFQGLEAEGQSFQANEGRWREERQSPRRLINQQATPGPWEELLERANSASSYKWCPQEDTKKRLSLLIKSLAPTGPWNIAGLLWGPLPSSSVTEKPYQLPLCWPLSYHPPIFLPQTWPWFPPNRTAGKELELCVPSAFLYFLPFHRPGDIANPTLLPSHSLFPQLGQGTEPTASLSWLQNPRKTYSPGPQRPRPSLRAGS